MKKLFKWISFVFFILFFFHSCVYHYITHMSEEELEWITNRHEGEVMCFKTDDGKQDTIIVCKIEVYNSLNPFNMSYFNTGKTEYIAGGGIDYRFIRSTGCEGAFYVQKLDNSKPLRFSGGLLERWSKCTEQKQISLKINNATLNDIAFFDESNTKQIRDSAQDNPIKSYAWSKKYGLVQYTFLDGTTFTRIDIGNQ